MGAAFWPQDWQYSLPTPRPRDLHQPAIGERVALDRKVSITQIGNTPVFLHFFNPACPCSNFNLDHVRDLIRKYGRRVRFVAVLQGDEDEEHLQQTFRNLDLGIDSVTDVSGAIAGSIGIYSTPQAVLIDRDGRLFYRGNYNYSRYCTLPETEYARIALDAMLAGEPPKLVPAAASVAYGCPLPKRKKSTGELVNP
jgi:hypothetical protein